MKLAVLRLQTCNDWTQLGQDTSQENNVIDISLPRESDIRSQYCFQESKTMSSAMTSCLFLGFIYTQHLTSIQAASSLGISIPESSSRKLQKLTTNRFNSRRLLNLRGGGKFNFEVVCKDTKFGECVGLVGSSAKLGDWKTPIKMNGKSFPLWKASVDLEEGNTDLQYKYCIIGANDQIKSWESSGDNRRLPADVLAAGQRNDGQFGAGAGRPAPPPPAHGGHHDGAPDLGRADVKVASDGQLDAFGAELVRADKAGGSWRQKLDAVKALFYDAGAAAAAGFDPAAPKTEHLASIAIYLHFLSTGQARRAAPRLAAPPLRLPFRCSALSLPRFIPLPHKSSPSLSFPRSFNSCFRSTSCLPPRLSPSLPPSPSLLVLPSPPILPRTPPPLDFSSSPLPTPLPSPHLLAPTAFQCPAETDE